MRKLNIVFRRATAEDLDEIMRLENSVFPHDAWSAQNMQNEILSTHCFYIVAVENGEAEGAVEETHFVEGMHFTMVPGETKPSGPLVGYAGLFAPFGTGAADIHTIAVAPTQRRRRIGQTLMHILLEEAHRRGVEHVFLEVRANNAAAQSLYRSLGFQQIRIRPRYYPPDGADAVVMRRTFSRDLAPSGTTPPDSAPSDLTPSDSAPSDPTPPDPL